MSKYEEKIITVLKKSHIAFVREKTFEDLRGGKYRYDFYIPSSNILIEVDG
jgi:very-short-patch-repair endonuclease